MGEEEQWQVRQMLTERAFPPRLRSYLGAR